VRAPLDLSGGRPTNNAELSQARELVRRSGLVEVLEPYLVAEVGRPRLLTLEAFLVVAILNALHRHHQAHLVEIARTLNALTAQQQELLGLKRWDKDQSYDRVERLFVELAETLESKVSGLDATEFANRLLRAGIPKDLLVSRSWAVDGTDVDTWGALRSKSVVIDLDGDAIYPPLEGQPRVPRVTKGRQARVLAIGPDGRKQYTADPDARAGHRSATATRNAGTFVGYELHMAVQTRDVRWTNYVDRTSLGPEVAGLITTANLVPAGSHRGDAIVSSLIDSKRDGYALENVVWDPGYSLCKPGTTVYPLAAAGIEQTMELVTHQRGIRPFSGDALLLDGHLFSPGLPKELRDLPPAPRYMPGHYKAAFEKKYNQRAQWRLVRHSAPDRDGVTRWRCPFCAGLLRSRQLPATMRRSRSAPLASLPEHMSSCCRGTISVAPTELPLTQRIPYGTTAWRISMERRQVVESANSALKGAYTDVSRGFFRVFGRTKITVLLSFTLLAYNLDRVRSFRAKLAEIAGAPARRARRRPGTWHEVVNAPADRVIAHATGPPG
jgi:hypothetical protein